MATSSFWQIGPNGERAEVATFEFQGKEFTSGGAFVSPTHAVGYPDNGTLRAWDGTVLGTCRIVSRWATPNSWLSSHQCQVEATIDGIRYTGRGAGNGMLWRGRRKANQ